MRHSKLYLFLMCLMLPVLAFGQVLNVSTDGSVRVTSAAIDTTSIDFYHNSEGRMTSYAISINDPASRAVLNLELGEEATIVVADTTAVDFSYASNDGDVYGATYGMDRWGNSAGADSLNGVDQYIEKVARPVGGYPFTMMGWAYQNSSATTAGAVVMIADNTVSSHIQCIYIGDDGYPAMCARSSFSKIIIDSTAVRQDEWVHLAYVAVSRTERHLYVNGVLKGTDIRDVEFEDGGTFNVYSVGRLGDLTADGYFDGKLDDVLIIPGALSQAEISALANDRNPVYVNSAGLESRAINID